MAQGPTQKEMLAQLVDLIGEYVHVSNEDGSGAAGIFEELVVYKTAGVLRMNINFDYGMDIEMKEGGTVEKIEPPREQEGA